MRLVYPITTGCLCANSHPGSYSGQDAYNDMLCVLETGSQTSMWGGVAGALNCMHDQQAVIQKAEPPRKYIVRRLTPLECCRLQGFPDWWMDGVEGSDSAKYKMWGNGIALPCAADVLRRIAKELNEEDTNV